MKAVIMAGGKGTRLGAISQSIPKPMVPVNGKPIIEYQIESLKRSGIHDILLVTGHLGNVISDYFKDGSAFGVSIRYFQEDHPMGTAGSLKYLPEDFIDDFLLVFGDLMLDIDWQRFMEFHKRKKAWITLFGHPNSHPYDSDLILTDSDDLVTGIDSKNHDRNYFYHNFVNAGIYAVSRRALNLLNDLEKADLEKDVIQKLIPERHVYAYSSSEYVKDMGTPERMEAVKEDLENGIVSCRSLIHKQKCIFLDRDGTINVLKGFLNHAEDMELIPGAAEGIRRINHSEYLAICATNQPVVARGECSMEELYRIHHAMETLLGREGAYLDAVYFCPHHPDRGFAGEVKELKIDCDCRKPKTGLLKQAAVKYNIGLRKSWFIGDSTVDIQTGINAGMRTILVHTGMNGQDHKYDARADYEAADLNAAVDQILKG